MIVCILCFDFVFFFFFSSRRRHTRYWRDWSSDVCSSDLCHDCLPSFHKVDENHISCPIDNKVFSNKAVFSDKCCLRDILNLQCYCVWKNQGCTWSNSYCYLQDHLQECEHVLKPCLNDGCQEMIFKHKMDDHVSIHCEFRKVQCKNCDGTVKLNVMTKHLERCPKIIISCIKECGTKLPRDALHQHLEEECPLTEHKCGFSIFDEGCHFVAKQEEMEKHERETVSHHLGILNAATRKQKIKMEEQESQTQLFFKSIDEVEMKLANQNEVLANTKQDLQVQQIKMNTIEKSISEQKAELIQIQDRLTTNEVDKKWKTAITVTASDATQVTAQLEECMTLLKETERRVCELERNVKEMKMKPMNFKSAANFGPHSLFSVNPPMNLKKRIDNLEMRYSSHDGMIIWKINDFEQLFFNAVSGLISDSYFSPSFYVGRYGYKMCAKAYLNGNGIGKNTHMSLFIVIMKGEYDALLRWPFNQKVSFQLYDQNNTLDVVDELQPYPESSSFQRPTETMNVASGMPQFISHADLRSRGYIKNDSIFIKIVVDMTGMPKL